MSEKVAVVVMHARGMAVEFDEPLDDMSAFDVFATVGKVLKREWGRKYPGVRWHCTVSLSAEQETTTADVIPMMESAS